MVPRAEDLVGICNEDGCVGSHHTVGTLFFFPVLVQNWATCRIKHARRRVFVALYPISGLQDPSAGKPIIVQRNHSQTLLQMRE